MKIEKRVLGGALRVLAERIALKSPRLTVGSGSLLICLVNRTELLTLLLS